MYKLVIDGTTTAKLALSEDCITAKDYKVEDIVEMNLTEQGVKGPFRITSIKHVLPQKVPEYENSLDENFEYRPITGIFAHHSTKVWKVALEIGDTLGVTFQHPIYTHAGASHPKA